MTGAPESRDPSRASTLGGQADVLVADFLDAGAATMHARLGEVAGVGVSTNEGEMALTLGASTVLAAEVDRIQFDIGVGPCLHALRTGEALYVADLAADGRWGEYGPAPAERGASSRRTPRRSTA